ncbi:unnamed protein product [Symbiodinium necroappetens]|uniref:Uncharacterized protein n=1 Tax=Symbiodinium necroappetens TaxID=1628268 RepID=A0A812Y1C2_9DINO|nr:unnamed protein product [Symbiodinium necroappetens]
MGGSGRWHRLDEGRWARARSLQMDSIFDDAQDAPYAVMAFALHCLDRSDLEQLLQMGLHHRWSWRIREIYEKAVDAYFTEHFGEDFSETFGISSLSLQDLSQVVAIMRCWKAGNEDAEALEAELCRLCQVDLAPKTEERFRFLEEAAAVADDDQDAEEDEDSPEEDEQPVTKMQAEPTEVEEEPEESHLIGILRPKRPRKKLHKRMVPKPSLLKRNRPLQRSSLQSLLSIPDPEREVDPDIFPEIEPESEVDGSGRSSSDVAPHTSVKRIVPKPSMLRRNRPLQDSVQGRTSARRMRFGLSSSLR